MLLYCSQMSVLLPGFVNTKSMCEYTFVTMEIKLLSGWCGEGPVCPNHFSVLILHWKESRHGVQGLGDLRVLQLCSSLAAFLWSKCSKCSKPPTEVKQPGLLKIPSIQITQARAAQNNLLPPNAIMKYCPWCDDLPSFKCGILS